MQAARCVDCLSRYSVKSDKLRLATARSLWAVPLVQQLAKIAQFPCCATTTGPMAVVRRRSEARNSLRISWKLHLELEVNNTVVGRTVQIEGQ